AALIGSRAWSAARRESPPVTAFLPEDWRLKLGHLAETLGFAAAGGTAVGLLGVPAGWMSGSMLTVATAALAGRPMFMPQRLMQAIYVLVGTSLGSVVTPKTLHGVTSYPLSLIALIITMAAISVASSAYLRVVHGWDRLSAFLASAPGALSQVIITGAELGADLRAIAIVQTMRILIVAIGLPSGLALFGLVGPAVRPFGGPLSAALLDELAILFAVSAAGAILAYKI